MKPLRVLQIVPSISLVYGGPSQMVRGFSGALTAAGAEVTVLTTDSNGDVDQPPLDVPLNQPVSEDGYTVYYFRCAPFRRYKFSWELLRWLALNAQNYDIAHIHALFSPLSTAAATIARLRRLPYLLRPLGTLDPADLAKKRKLKRFYGTLLEKSNLAGAAGIHFTSSQEAEVSDRFGAKTKDFVIPLGVTPSEPLPENSAWKIADDLGIPNYFPRILFLSRIDPKKGLELLLTALESLREDGVEFHLILAGANPQDPKYEKSVDDRIAGSNLANCTTITGFVSGETKTALLQISDLFVLPSYYENFGIAVAEAMAAGLPVLISKGVYIWQEVAADNAGWICDLSPKDIAQHLRIALNTTGERRRRGKNARALARAKYEWEAIAARTLEIYGEILGER